MTVGFMVVVLCNRDAMVGRKNERYWKLMAALVHRLRASA